MFSNFSVHQHHLEGLLKFRLLASPEEFLNQFLWGGAQETAFPTSSQVMVMLLVCGPELGDHPMLQAKKEITKIRV